MSTWLEGFHAALAAMLQRQLDERREPDRPEVPRQIVDRVTGVDTAIAPGFGGSDVTAGEEPKVCLRIDAVMSTGLQQTFPYWGGLGELIRELTGDQPASDTRPWRATTWWRVLRPDGTLWTETNDEDEARRESAKKGWPAERLWEWSENGEEWRRE